MHILAVARTAVSPSVEKDEGLNILGIVVFSIFLGAVLSSMGPSGKPLLDFFETLHESTMKLTMLVIWCVLICKTLGVDNFMINLTHEFTINSIA